MIGDNWFLQWDTWKIEMTSEDPCIFKGELIHADNGMKLQLHIPMPDANIDSPLSDEDAEKLIVRYLVDANLLDFLAKDKDASK